MVANTFHFHQTKRICPFKSFLAIGRGELTKNAVFVFSGCHLQPFFIIFYYFWLFFLHCRLYMKYQHCQTLNHCVSEVPYTYSSSICFIMTTEVSYIWERQKSSFLTPACSFIPFPSSFVYISCYLEYYYCSCTTKCQFVPSVRLRDLSWTIKLISMLVYNDSLTFFDFLPP